MTGATLSISGQESALGRLKAVRHWLETEFTAVIDALVLLDRGYTVQHSVNHWPVSDGLAFGLFRGHLQHLLWAASTTPRASI